jgi:hypothetical protein
MPTGRLGLSATYDAAFDRKLITFDGGLPDGALGPPAGKQAGRLCYVGQRLWPVLSLSMCLS